MSIREHYNRSGRVLLWLAAVVFFIGVIFFLYDYILLSQGEWRSEHIEYGYVLLMSLVLVWSGVRSKRHARQVDLPLEGSAPLLSLSRLMLRPEPGALQRVVYFSMTGEAIAELREEYDSKIHGAISMILSFILRSFMPQRFVFYTNNQPVLSIRKQGGIGAVYALYQNDGTYMGKLADTWSVKRVEWKVYDQKGEAVAHLGGTAADWIQGSWEDGGRLEMKEDGIPMEAIKTFQLSGGTLLDIQANDVIPYVIPGLIITANQNRK